MSETLHHPSDTMLALEAGPIQPEQPPALEGLTSNIAIEPTTPVDVQDTEAPRPPSTKERIKNTTLAGKEAFKGTIEKQKETGRRLGDAAIWGVIKGIEGAETVQSRFSKARADRKANRQEQKARRSDSAAIEARHKAAVKNQIAENKAESKQHRKDRNTERLEKVVITAISTSEAVKDTKEHVTIVAKTAARQVGKAALIGIGAATYGAEGVSRVAKAGADHVSDTRYKVATSLNTRRAEIAERRAEALITKSKKLQEKANRSVAERAYRNRKGKHAA